MSSKQDWPSEDSPAVLPYARGENLFFPEDSKQTPPRKSRGRGVHASHCNVHARGPPREGRKNFRGIQTPLLLQLENSDLTPLERLTFSGRNENMLAQVDR